MKCIFFVSIFFLLNGNLYSLTQVYYEDLFKSEVVPTEYKAYCLMREYYPKVDYLSVPWAMLINSKQFGNDLFNLVYEIEDFPGSITVCQHIRYHKIIPILQKLGVKILFTPHAKKNEQHDALKVLPFPHFPMNGVNPAKNKDILYSFVGASQTHWTRKEIMKLPRKNDTVLIDRSEWHWARETFRPNCNTAEEQEQEKQQYQDILARSRFSLCPRGTGPSTIRFWESLQAGAIPVLIGDDMVLPEGVEWDKAVITIDLVEIEFIDEKIRNISGEMEREMRERCLQLFRDFFTGNNFVRELIKER